MVQTADVRPGTVLDSLAAVRSTQVRSVVPERLVKDAARRIADDEPNRRLPHAAFQSSI